MLAVQLWTGKATLGDAMLSTLQQLPRRKWMITTLGKRGSVLINHQQQVSDQDQDQEAHASPRLDKTEQLRSA